MFLIYNLKMFIIKQIMDKELWLVDTLWENKKIIIIIIN